MFHFGTCEIRLFNCKTANLLDNGAMGENQIVIYTSPNGEVWIETHIKGDSIWLTQQQIADLFETERSVITKHLGNIFKNEELEEESNVQKMHIANSDKPAKLYSLDAILSVGYRVNSKKATQFRIWATKTLKNQILRGYSVDERLLLAERKRLEEIRDRINEMLEG